jgi:hypothetical protein
MNTSAKFNFTDAFSGGDLNANVMYDISVLDSSGKQVFEKKGLMQRILKIHKASSFLLQELTN